MSILLLLLFIGPSSVSAQVPERAPSHRRRVSPELEAEAGSPLGDRVLLTMAGVGTGLVAAGVVGTLGALISAAVDSSTWNSYSHGVGAAVVGSLLTVPASIYLFGELSGRNGAFDWTLLGGVLGALPGLGLLVAGILVDEADRGPPDWFYAGGGILTGVGLITGSILALELSRDAAPSVKVEVGLGTLRLHGHF